MTNEKYYIAQKDFEAYNPHYDLKNPIKIKKNDLLLCNGGMPEEMLHDNGVIAKYPYFLVGEFAVELKSDKDMVDYARGYATHSMLVSGRNPIFDFRTIDKTRKDEFNKKLLNFEVQIPLFYWFEDYSFNLAESKLVETKDVCGKNVVLTDGIGCVTDKEYLAVSIDDVGIVGFVEKNYTYKGVLKSFLRMNPDIKESDIFDEKKTDKKKSVKATIDKAKIIDIANKVVDDLVKEISSILRECDK